MSVKGEWASPLTDSVPSLITQLCKLQLLQHTDKPISPASFCLHEQKERVKRQLKIKAFETIFCYLKEHKSRKKLHSDNELTAVDSVYSWAFHLRCQRRFEDASRLEKLLGIVCADGPSEDVCHVMDFLLKLKDSTHCQQKTVIGHQKDFLHVANTGRLLDEVILPSGPLLYGDTKIDNSAVHSFMHFPRKIFEVSSFENLETSLYSLPAFKSFTEIPGSEHSAVSFLNKMAHASSEYTASREASLFGALVQSRVFTLNAKLDIPDLNESGEISIPQFRRKDRTETSEDEGFVDAMTPSTELSFQSQQADSISGLSQDVWNEAKCFNLNEHYTWEASGRVAADVEKPYLTEAGPCAFDCTRTLYRANRLQMVDECLPLTAEHVISMNDLVVDILHLLLAIPSRTFVWQQDHFVISEGLHIPGLSPESVQQQCADILDCGTNFHLLCEFSRSRLPRSTDEYGLLLEAFRRGIRQYLQYYRACVLSIPCTEMSVLSVTIVMRKLMTQIQFLVRLCNLHRDSSQRLPNGFRLLSYLYEECLLASSSLHYPVLLSLLATTVEPYLCMVRDWMFRGTCQDMYGEFMLQVNHEYVGRRDELYWSRSYMPSEGDIAHSVPTFLKDLAAQIFVCGKSINLLKLCSRSKHFLVTEEHFEVPPLQLTFSNTYLLNSLRRFEEYFDGMRAVAKQKMQTRLEVKQQMERAKSDLQARVRQAAAQRLQKLQVLDMKDEEASLKMRTKEDARKRKLFAELKQQMERGLRQKVIDKENALAADKAYMESVQKQELLEASIDTALVQQAKEELVAHYAELNKEMELREKRAQWRIRRHQLDRRRENYLRVASDDWPLTSASDDFIVEPPTKSASMFLERATNQFTLGLITASHSSPNLSSENEVLDGRDASEERQLMPAGSSDPNIRTSGKNSGAPTAVDPDVTVKFSHSKWEKPEAATAPFADNENTKSVAGVLPNWALSGNASVEDFQFTERMISDNSRMKCEEGDIAMMGQSADDASASDERWCIKPVAGYHHSNESVPRTENDLSLADETRSCIQTVVGYHHSNESVPRTEDDVSVSDETRSCIKTVVGYHHSNESVPRTENDLSLADETRSCIQTVVGYHHSNESVPRTEDDVSVSDETRSCIKTVVGYHHSNESVPRTEDDASFADETRSCIKTVAGYHHTSESKSVAEQPHIKMVPSHNTNQESTESEQRLNIKMVCGKHVTDVSDALNYVMGTRVAPTREERDSPKHDDDSVAEAADSNAQLMDSGSVKSDIKSESKELEKELEAEEATIDTHVSSADTATKTCIKSVTGKHAALESSLAEPSYKPCIKVSADHGATTESSVSQRSMQEEFGIPRLKRNRPVDAGTQSIDWIEFSSYQVRRSFVPRRRRVDGQSVDRESVHRQDGAEESRLPPRTLIKMSKSMSAIKESDPVDHEAIRRGRFLVRNVHGHMSDSTIQKLLYGDAANKTSGSLEVARDDEESEKFAAVDFAQSLWIDRGVVPYQDDYACFDHLPVTDLVSWKRARDGELDTVSKHSEENGDLDMHKITPLPVILERSVIEPLRAQISLVNEIVVNYFMVELDIGSHFAALHQFILLQDGEFAQNLTDQLFDKLSNHKQPKDFLNPMYLNTVLHKALAASIHAECKNASNVSFIVKPLPKTSMKAAPDALDYLELGYKVNWPFNLIITDGVLKKYSHIFSFMLKLKRAVWVLKGIFHRLKRDALQSRSNSQQMHALQLYRHEMQHFAKVLHEYIANQVITILWHEFQVSLEGDIEGIDGLRQLHVNYINKSMSRCLLTRNAAPVLKIISSMFGLIQTFSSQLSSQSWQHDATSNQLRHPAFDYITRTYTAFHEHSLFLFKVVDQLAVRGYQPHFDELLLRLNYNGFYKSDRLQ